MPVRHDAVVFPKFFTTNKSLDLPYIPYDPTWTLLGENRSLPEQGSLCFQFDQRGDCIQLTYLALGWFYGKRTEWVNIRQENVGEIEQILITLCCKKQSGLMVPSFDLIV